MPIVLLVVGVVLVASLAVWAARLIHRYRETAPPDAANVPMVVPADYVPPAASPATPASPWLEREPHPHPWRLPLVVTGAVVVVAFAVWFAELRPRVDAATVQEHVALTHPGATIGCSQRTVNASQFECAVVYQAESECVAVSVSVQGSIARGRTAPSACAIPALEKLVTWPPTPTMVAADVTRIVGGDRFICAHTSSAGTRFACARSTADGHDCRIVRVTEWTPMKPRPGGDECSRIPALKQAVIG